ncbi:Eco57I restriction-modification methylase domain-containing protein [Spirillospora sp. NPDC127200]
MKSIETVSDLLGIALELGARDVSGWSRKELVILDEAHRCGGGGLVEELRLKIQAGEDPLGEAYCQIVTPEQRRPLGQTYTPRAIVESMLAWASGQGAPDRVVDPGIGSARYLVAAGQQWQQAELVGADVDPVATIMARANLAASGLASRSNVLLKDYRSLELQRIEGSTLFIGNPPYVRHHQIPQEWKQWLVRIAKKQGLAASQLAGLHVHFFLATSEHARVGDFGTFITSAEWLDVNYGRLVRELLLGDLGGQGVYVLDPKMAVFSDATTTAAISCFTVGQKPSSLRLRQVKKVEDLGALGGGRKVSRERLAEATRWGPLVRATPKLPEGYVELGELCRVHRGQVTGSNSTWITRPGVTALPERFLFPSVTRARELFEAGEKLLDRGSLRLVIDLPTDLDELDVSERKAVDQFLVEAKRSGAAEGYIARKRRAWWSVGLRAPAPILATYMARRPPAFVRNFAEARHINIAHGLYPREQLAERVIENLARYLRTSVALGQGRTYAGGLTKFEPREMERLPVPALEVLLSDAAAPATRLD